MTFDKITATLQEILHTTLQTSSADTTQQIIMEYAPNDIEKKWRPFWEEAQIYRTTEDAQKPKYYILDMFPYPSGAGLHVGHPLGYVASDIFARYKRFKGFNVLHPMGYDAFGLPAEQYAIETGIHPETTTKINLERYRQQLDNLGLSFDWSRQVNTADPSYYRWTQQIFVWLFEHYYDKTADKALPVSFLAEQFAQVGNAFVQAANSYEGTFTAQEWAAFSATEREEILMNYRLAYRKVGFVNWCEALGTVLANDEVKEGVSERGGYPVVKKPMMQWVLRITAYADRLLSGLDTIDFSEAIKTQQRNWIGKSEGAQVFYPIENSDLSVEVFTTRPDTIYGATFIVLAPEHDLVKNITTVAQQAAIDEYLAYAGARSERERMIDIKNVTGAFTGAYARHPLTGVAMPIWISDYVLVGYGTGAVMAVPAEDERDNRFATHFGLAIIPVLDKSATPEAVIGEKVGTYINSPLWNGCTFAEGLQKALAAIEIQGLGKRKVNFKLHDANFSRQRYWGEPFPIKYTPEGIAQVETNLPLVLPDLHDFHPTAAGESPLARVADWCISPEGWQRETDTMPGYAGSSWYFLRYMDPQNENEPFSATNVDYWQEVDLYVGGSEHAVGHLLYARFWHKFLHDLGKVPTDEPFRRLVNQGMIQGIVEYVYMLKEKRDGRSVFVSADNIEQYGEDAAVLIPVYIKFVTDYGSPDSFLDLNGIEQFKAWRSDYADAIFETNSYAHLVTKSEVGKMSKRYHNVVNPDEVVAEYGTDCFRMYEMFLGPLEDSKPWNTKGIDGVHRFLRKFWSLFFDKGELIISQEAANEKELRTLHTCIKKINHDLENLSLNTCISGFMIAVNELKEQGCHKAAILRPLVQLIAPFAPYIAEELWAALGEPTSIHLRSDYPQHNEAYLIASEVTYPICINGKLRLTLTFSAKASKEEIEKETLSQEKVQEILADKQLLKIILVPNKMVNLVVK
jgi:leucyl-tRNA synthetase